MYIGIISDLAYEIYAIGKTQKECKENLVKGFYDYLNGYDMTLDEWLEEHDIDLGEYKNDLLIMLEEYYGMNIFDASKGYALGWE